MDDRRKTRSTRPIALVGLIAALALGGIGLQGCGSSSKSAVKATTTGQELTDLKRALDEGVISKSEYERKRGEILRH